ncbi:MAG: ABC transporter permease [Bdellovibrionales bacterium]|nr:ABC transporter permease [Oligoflexia bacterium]
MLRVSTPLIFAALGGMWCERSGVIQLGLEGFILIGSFFGAVSTLYFSNPYLGLFIAGLSGMLLSVLFGISTLRFRANQVVAGTAINLFALGVPPFLSKIWYDSTGSTPPIPSESQFHVAPLYLMGIAVFISVVFYSYTRFGLRLRFAGEHPKALEAAGVSILIKRWQGVLIAGFLAGVAGGTLSIYLSSSFIRNMSAGRGYIALAAVILGKWKPIPTVLACLLFGLTEQMQIRLQGVILWGSEPVPVQWIQILPYLITLVVLAFAVGRSFAPKALGQLE